MPPFRLWIVDCQLRIANESARLLRRQALEDIIATECGLPANDIDVIRSFGKGQSRRAILPIAIRRALL
jgi:hypothetical protein